MTSLAYHPEEQQAAAGKVERMFFLERDGVGLELFLL